ncbi:histone acetyltransferase [Candida albicans L26]|uniref:histone acetyltransferase n=1 Tax=Candida albicans (strain SC5314 / ATCC MYA-2876) TaxID=237561 RepID=Q5ACY2_CANAL|nr:Sas2p [Candida albicans SC5314]KGU16117.1 histone acetyltransferase [Candida albicans L26]KHC59180.1 histone acetyltransferase [Candida albicans P37039]KHC66446.1 histone acetyltransferase [Candida albicans P75010]AOW27098.1 Sas2p [Candida albicans SC5314]KHC81120.1 histone acetyltransferase [Candida albicans SC5314]|eukprot:XP_719533.1 Sas2p [Candida albicans SC5314]
MSVTTTTNIIKASPKRKTKTDTKDQDNSYYGQLNKRNINKVTFGKYEFPTWYGNAAYFYPHDLSHSSLGYEYANKVASEGSIARKIHKKDIFDENLHEFWLDHLFVCEYCFKYTSNETILNQHVTACTYNRKRPSKGKLLYHDQANGYIIREVRGFQDPLFCQNLCLFGKLFLDDKSVYYNIDHFDFYIVFGKDDSSYIPMGFFSKEVLSYDNDNNLACICVFPPFQRRHLGSLLIEFSYQLAAVTPGQLKSSGPEFPLSPYGKVTYLRFWSKRLATKIHELQGSFTLSHLSKETGFRKEDILLTLEYMQILVTDDLGNVTLSLERLENWCSQNKVVPGVDINILNSECLIL